MNIGTTHDEPGKDSARFEKHGCSEKTRSGLEDLGLNYYDDMWCLPSTPAHLVDALKNFQFREDDIMVVSYPKAGVYWLADLVWLLQNDLDFEGSSRTPIGLRVPFLEHRNAGLDDPLALLDTRPSPRLMKTHFRSELFSLSFACQEPKSVVLLRNPKDILAAIYLFYRSNPYFQFKGGWTDFYHLFKENSLVEGNYLESTLSWWNRRHDKNVLVIKFCDLTGNPQEVLKRMATFLGVSVTDGQIMDMSDWLDTQLAKEKSRQNGIWREFFEEEELRHLQENVYFELAKHGLIFL